MKRDENEGEQREWRRRFREIMRSLPQVYPDAKKMAVNISHVFHQELAAAIEPRLNLFLREQPLDTYEQRHDLAAWTNRECRDLHLSIRCPKTGLAATLGVDTRSPEDDTSRFRLIVRDDKARYPKTYSSADLLNFQLMEDPPRREGLYAKGKKDDHEKRQR